MQKSSTNKYSLMPGLRQFVVLLIFMLKSVTDSMLPCGTPSSGSFHGKWSKIRILNPIFSSTVMSFLKDNTLNYKKIKNSNSDLFCVVCAEAINIGYLLKSENCLFFRHSFLLINNIGLCLIIFFMIDIYIFQNN